ncbi:SDR family NAD(P)-dependent oxidoreductase [Massilia sp. TN1-12]|uniref:SDR family NAD(P)-dependent oxidoreductase n=1 Tax=Massilia paldalensis TaxID=3377675 RepID=UPI0038510CF5
MQIDRHTGMQETALVLGASGGIGGEVARRLLREGWNVRALSRRAGGEARRQPDIAWIQGDAEDAAAVRAAAAGCAVIVHAVNPPGYRDWDKLVLPMVRNAMAAADAASSAGALVVVAGSVYNYGPDTPSPIAEGAPQHPATRKGAVRVRVEEELEAWCARGGRALVVRAGDFFGPHAGNNWFGQGLVKPGRPITRIANPVRGGAGHQWAYLPDVAATMVALIVRRATLAPFARYHMGGHWDADGTAMVGAIRRVAAVHGLDARVSRFPWWLVPLLAPFNVTMRELGEMRYLWEWPVRLDNAKLVAELGAEPHTPLDEAVSATLAGLGCLPAGAGLRQALA